MGILNSLPTKIGIATETSNGLMTAEDKKLVNKINRIESDVADKMNKSDKIKSSQLDTSSNAVKIQEVNLSDEVKQMIAGGKPVAVPDIRPNTLVTDYYANNSVTSDKRTAVGSVAVIVSTEFCNFNTNGDTEVSLSIPGNYTIYFGADRRDIEDTPESLTLPKGEPSVIVYSKIYGFSTYHIDAIKEDDFIVGAFDGTNVTMFNGRYTVNGSVVIGDQSLDGSAIKDFSLDSNKIAIQHGIILSDKTLAPYINVNFTSNFVEVINKFDVTIADQYTIDIDASDQCRIPENIDDGKYLYIYYDLGTNNLNAIWSSSDTTQTILNSNKKLVLLGIIYDSKVAVGFNSEFISVNSVSIKNKLIDYIKVLSGKVVIDFKNKQLTASNLKAFIDDKLVNLTENETQTIKLTDDIITNIISSGIPYTLGVVRVDFDRPEYRLVFVKTEDIKSMGLDAFALSSIKRYDLSDNSDFITIIKQNGDVVKTNTVISSGYTLPIDNETIVVEMSTEVVDGNLVLNTVTLPDTSIVDPSTNTVYQIKESTKYQTIVQDLHGLYSVLFNTENGKIEIIPISEDINNKIYVSLGFVSELNDSLAYTALGPITEHILLNAYRPSNYAVITGPDPDKGYDWSNNRLVLPKDIYLLANSQYSLYCQNMSMNSYIDNDYISYEIGMPHTSILTENVFNVNSPFAGDFETRIVGKFKGNNSCLFKDVNIHFAKPEGKELSVLCIGDDTVDMNMPSYIKEYLTQLGYTPTMLGTKKNVINLNGYGMKNLSEEFGEGYKGWRLTDFMCKTRRKDGTTYIASDNPFMNNYKFDFSHYMQSKSYEKVDVVVISVGLNDITGYHVASAVEKIEALTISQNIEQLPNLYKEMIANIHAYDSNIKIIINPTMTKGIDDDFNRKSLLLTETLIYDLKDINNVFVAPGYLTQPLFVSANKTSTDNYSVYNDINDTKIGGSVSSTEMNGVAQSNLAYMITSTIVAVAK